VNPYTPFTMSMHLKGCYGVHVSGHALDHQRCASATMSTFLERYATIHRHMSARLCNRGQGIQQRCGILRTRWFEANFSESQGVLSACISYALGDSEQLLPRAELAALFAVAARAGSGW
jgi:hypothetical protein